MLGKLLFALSAVTALVNGSPIDVEERQVLGIGVLPPSTDPFYQPGFGWQLTSPGTILKSRTAPPLAGLTYKSAYQLLYRTTDSRGNPTTTVNTIIIPSGTPDFNKFVSYQIFYDSVDVDCSPSYSLTQPFQLQIDSGPSSLLNAGYIVSTSDYEGPLASFTSGHISGQATLDGVRATLASGAITGIKSSAKYVMWGYSGGALASEWAAELNGAYAPELNFAGIALGGLTPNVKTVALTINGGAFAGLLPAGVIGLASQSPAAQKALDENLVPSMAAKFYAAKKNCLPAQIAAGALTNYSSYFKQGLASLDLPASKATIQSDGLMGIHGTPKSNLYVYKGAKDQVSPVADTDALVQKYCNAGVKIQYVRDPNADHLGDQISGADAALTYVKNALNGKLPASNCGNNGIPK